MTDKKQPGGFQTFMFFLGLIVLFFLVFALGVIVGKGLDTEDLFQIRKKDKSDKLLASSSVTIIDKDEGEKPPKTEPKKAVKPQPKVSGKKQAPAKKKVEEVKTAKKPAPKKPVKPVQTKPEKKKEVKVTKKPEPEKVKEENYVAKLDYSKPDFPVTDQGGKYTVQLGSFQNIDAAYSLEKKLLAKGYPCFVIKAAIPKKGTWYRVRVGTFQTKEKAAAYAKQLKNIEKLEYSQVTLNK